MPYGRLARRQGNFQELRLCQGRPGVRPHDSARDTMLDMKENVKQRKCILE